MLKSKYKIYLLLLCLTGCVSEYNAQLPSSDEELLVVTGDIIANTEAIFSLSKSIPLSEDMPEDYRNIYARIAVVGSDGYRSDFGTALGDGKYQVSIISLGDDGIIRLNAPKLQIKASNNSTAAVPTAIPVNHFLLFSIKQNIFLFVIFLYNIFGKPINRSAAITAILIAVKLFPAKKDAITAIN